MGKKSISIIPLPVVCFYKNVPDFSRTAEICCAWL